MHIDYNHYDLSKKEKYGFYAAGYFCIFVILYLFYHSLAFSFAGGFLTVVLLPIYQKHKAEKRKMLLLAQFKDFLYSLSSYVAANIQILEALEGSLNNLKFLYDENTPFVEELSYMVKSVNENRENEIRLLKDFAQRSHCEDIENFVQVYSSCVITGGDLEKVLKNTIEIIMDKITIEREIRTMTSQKRFEGNIITAMPLIVIMFLNVFSPDYLEPLYVTVQGRLLMSGAIAGLITAHLMTRKMTDIEV